VKEVPKCEACGGDRVYEFQIMPQFYSFYEYLSFVDWGPIMVYTCNNSCGNEGTFPEFAHIEFSDEFEQVKFAEEKPESEPKKKRKNKRKKNKEGGEE